MAANELSQDDIDALLNRAAERARSVTGGEAPSPAKTRTATPAAPAAQAVAAVPAMQSTKAGMSTVETSGVFDDLLDIPLELRVRLGEAVMPIDQVAALTEGSVVELDRATGDPVDVLINNRVIARGEVVVVDDRFTVRLTEILAPTTAGDRE